SGARLAGSASDHGETREPRRCRPGCRRASRIRADEVDRGLAARQAVQSDIRWLARSTASRLVGRGRNLDTAVPGAEACEGFCTFRVTTSLSGWGSDHRAKVGAGSIGERIKRGMKPEAAITTPAFEA